MKGMKKILLLLAALIGGPALMISGYNDYQNSKKLLAGGKTTMGSVVDGREMVRRKSGAHTYYLTVKYVPEGAEPLMKELSVPRELYDQAGATRSIKVNYLPANPQVAQFGEKVEVKTSGMTVGALFFFGGVAFLVYCFVSRSRNGDHSSAEALAASDGDSLKKAA